MMTFNCNDHPIVPDKRLDSIFRHGRVQYFPGHQRGQGREDRPAFHGPCEDFHATRPEPDLREDHGALREAFPRHLPALSEGRRPALRGRQQLPHPRPAAAPSPCSISITSAPPGNAPSGCAGSTLTCRTRDDRRGRLFFVVGSPEKAVVAMYAHAVYICIPSQWIFLVHCSPETGGSRRLVKRAYT